MFNDEIYEFQFYKYMKDVAEGKIIASKYTILQCKKLLSDVEKSKNDDFEYYFDIDVAKNVINIIKNMKFESGKKQGQPLELANFQMNIILNTFCWRLKNDKDQFRFNHIVVFIPRKNGKSYIIAILAILATIKESGGQAVIASSKLDQAKIMYEQICGLITSHKSLAKAFKILKSEIRCNPKNSTIKALSSNAKGMDGINPHFVAIDEAMVVSSEVKSSLLTGGMMRKSVQNFYISTEYPINHKTGWMDSQIELAQKVLDGMVENDRMLSFIYRLENAEEIHNREAWIKANPIIPEIGDSYLEEQLQIALVNPNNMKELLIKNFNLAQTVEDDNAYLKMDSWKRCMSEEPIDWTGVHVNLGIDMSLTTDLSAVSFTGINDDGELLVHSHGFLPEESLLSGNRREKIDYRLLHEQGYCTITEGEVIDLSIVKDYIMSIEKKFGCIIDTIQFDPAFAQELMYSLSDEGFNVVEARQNKMTLSPPTKAFREKVYGGKVKYDKNPLLDWCMSCAITDMDNNGNEQLAKGKLRKNNKRIDLVAAIIFSYLETMKPKFNLDIYGVY